MRRSAGSITATPGAQPDLPVHRRRLFSTLSPPDASHRVPQPSVSSRAGLKAGYLTVLRAVAWAHEPARYSPAVFSSPSVGPPDTTMRFSLPTGGGWQDEGSFAMEAQANHGTSMKKNGFSILCVRDWPWVRCLLAHCRLFPRRLDTTPSKPSAAAGASRSLSATLDVRPVALDPRSVSS